MYIREDKRGRLLTQTLQKLIASAIQLLPAA